MSEMSDWIQTLGQRQGWKPDPQFVTPVEQATGVEPVASPAPVTQGDPAVPAPVTPGVPADLSGLVGGAFSGGMMDQDAFDRMGGEAFLERLRAIDPNASLYRGPLYGGEGVGANDAPQGYRFDYDPRALPSVTLPNGAQVAGNDALMQLARFDPNETSRYYNPEMQFTDPNYGLVTDRRNIKPDDPGPWYRDLERMAPYIAAAISMGAPIAAGALAAGGVGAGAAGAGFTTGAVTGSGVASAAGAAPWWAQPLSRLPQTVRGATSGGYGTFNPAGLTGAALGAAGSYFGVPSELTTAANIGAGIGQGMMADNPRTPTPPKMGQGVGQSQSQINTGGYDPTAMNAGGSTKKVQEDSSLVANQFAPGAYRNSNLWGYNG